MSSTHPPADHRCQIYITGHWDPSAGHYQRVARCVNTGTHWVHWGGCGCGQPDSVLCEAEYQSWECDSHTFKAAA